MKTKLILAPIIALTIWFNGYALANEPNYPAAPNGYIYDGAGIINPSDQAKIIQLLTELQAKTTAQVAVATVPSTQAEPIEMYAVKLFSQWGIGQKGKDNGVLFLIAKDDRNLRIEVGYGLEGALPDAICKNIISQMIVPAFKGSDFSGGILKGTTAIVSLIAKEYNVAVTGAEQALVDSSQPYADAILLFIILLFFFVVFFLLISGGHHNGGYGRPGNDSGGYWYGGSSGGFGGGSSGGFGGFGGGMSGGGGASGRW